MEEKIKSLNKNLDIILKNESASEIPYFNIKTGKMTDYKEYRDFEEKIISTKTNKNKRKHELINYLDSKINSLNEVKKEEEKADDQILEKIEEIFEIEDG